MAELPLDQAIPRFKTNEDRIDTFVNGDENATYTTSGGVQVPSVRKVVEDLRADGVFRAPSMSNFLARNDVTVLGSRWRIDTGEVLDVVAAGAGNYNHPVSGRGLLVVPNAAGEVFLSAFGAGASAIQAWAAASSSHGVCGIIAAPVDIGGSITVSGLPGLDLRTAPGGELRFSGSGKLIFSGCDGAKIALSHAGSLSTRVQFGLHTDGLQNLFADPGDWAYIADDGTVSDGSALTATFSGGILTMQLAAGVDLLGANVRWRVQSSPLTLDPAKRYVIVAEDGILGGTGGGSELEIMTFDGSGNPVTVANGANGKWNPQNTGINYQYCWLTGASSIKLRAAVRRGYQSAVGLYATYDLSKIRIFELVNDYAAWSNTKSLDASLIQFSACENLRWEPGATGRDHIGTGVQLIDCPDAVVDGLVSSGVVNSIGATGCRNLKKLRCHSDGRMQTTDGEWIFDRAMRGRALNASDNPGLLREGCTSIGHSWACESLNNDGSQQTHSGNTDYGAMVALSLHNSNPNCLVIGCDLRVQPGGLFALEHTALASPGSTGKIVATSMAFDSLDWFGIGLSVSKPRDVECAGCSIIAPVGVQAVALSVLAPNRVRVTGGMISYGHTAGLAREASLVLHDVDTRRVSNHPVYNLSTTSAPQPAAIEGYVSSANADQLIALCGGSHDPGTAGGMAFVSGIRRIDLSRTRVRDSSGIAKPNLVQIIPSTTATSDIDISGMLVGKYDPTTAARLPVVVFPQPASGSQFNFAGIDFIPPSLSAAGLAIKGAVYPKYLAVASDTIAAGAVKTIASVALGGARKPMSVSVSEYDGDISSNISMWAVIKSIGVVDVMMKNNGTSSYTLPACTLYLEAASRW